MTAQEVFDKVATHLLKQGVCSADDDNDRECLYRGPNGTMCAAGALIPDDKYDPILEGFPVTDPRVWSVLGLDDCLKVLVFELQCVHDTRRYYDKPNFVTGLRDVALTFGLNAAVLP